MSTRRNSYDTHSHPQLPFLTPQKDRTDTPAFFTARFLSLDLRPDLKSTENDRNNAALVGSKALNIKLADGTRRTIGDQKANLLELLATNMAKVRFQHDFGTRSIARIRNQSAPPSATSLGTRFRTCLRSATLATPRAGGLKRGVNQVRAEAIVHNKRLNTKLRYSKSRGTMQNLSVFRRIIKEDCPLMWGTRKSDCHQGTPAVGRRIYGSHVGV
jgi:hypothetical protein